jgi:glycine/sarcosine N-methyltransferase
MMKSETPFYTDIADYYDAIFPLNEAAVRWTERHLKDQHKTDLLDIGCGTGSLALALAGKFASAAGIDLDARMIEKARKKAAASGSSAVFHVLDMLDCAKKFTNESFGAVLCLGNTIAHLTQPEDTGKFFSVVYRLLSPGGTFLLQGINYNYILDNNITALPPIEQHGVKFIRSYKPAQIPGLLEFSTMLSADNRKAVITGNTLHNPLRPDTLQALLQAAGFSDIKLSGGFDDSPLTPQSLPLVISCGKA